MTITRVAGLALALTVVAVTSTPSALADIPRDSRSAEKNYLGSPSYQPLTKQQDLNYLLQRDPTAAGLPQPAPEGRFQDSRSVENNYLGSPTYRPVERDTGLNYLLKDQPPAAGVPLPQFQRPADGPYRIRGR